MDTERIIYHLRTTQAVLNEAWIAGVRHDPERLAAICDVLLYTVRDLLRELEAARQEAA